MAGLMFRSTATLAILLGAGIAGPAYAQSCKSSGNLVYLGNTRDAANSVWLSGTNAGAFSLESAQGNQTVDTWTQDRRRGLHLSRSPVVSQGNGGTHRLFNLDDSKPCLVDTQNQKRDWKLPPNIQLPGGRPGGGLPPIGGIFPEFRPPGLMPTLPPRPPGGLLPTLPPGGFRPPTGLMPTRPPIAARPPTGVMPTLPSRPPGGGRPPSGLMPTLPGGVQPPIGTLPPTGVMPTLPGGVQPPIGTLPPDGVTPTQPGGVQPPIAILPPGVQPPDGTLPPDSRPSAPSAGPQAKPGRRQVVVAGRVITCPDPGIARTRQRLAAAELDACLPQRRGAAQPAAPPSTVQQSAVPLTPGRDLLPDTGVNAWSETNFTSVRDGRYGLDFETLLGSATFGADGKLTEDLALGLSFGLESSRTTGFNRQMRAEGRGFTIGPYIAYRLSPNWAIDASLTYGLSSNDLRILSLDGDYLSQRFSISSNLHGQYEVGGFRLRPKLSATFSHMRNDAYQLSGNIFDLPINIRTPDSSFNYGVAEATFEISKVYSLSDTTQLMPYLQVGAQYEFVRPDGGQILTGDLALATPSPWSGKVRGGARMLLANRIQIDASAGYLSVGQNNLDIWEGKLNISFAF